MQEPPTERCGYTFPPDYEVGNNPRHQNSCYRESLPDSDRCAWHAHPDTTEHKTKETLQAARTPTEIRHQTQPAGELLDGAVLVATEIESALSLKNISLRGANLTDANLTGTNLDGANLTGADLLRTDLTGASLCKANLNDARLADANLTDADLSYANLTDAGLRADLPSACLANANLTNADLSYADLTEANLGGALLTDAKLEGAEMNGAGLGGALLTGANLTNADMNGAYLQADLTNADLQGANLTDAYLRRADLTGADFRKATLREATLPSGGVLSKVNLSEANLQNLDLSERDLSEATLAKADLTDADLSRTNLSGANLERALLNRADLFDTRFAGTRLDGTLFGDAQVNEGTFQQLAPDSDATDHGRVLSERLRRLVLGPTGHDAYRCVYDPASQRHPPKENYEKGTSYVDDDPEVRAGGVYRQFERLAGENALPKWQSRFFILRQDMQTRQKTGLDRAFALVQRALFAYGESFGRVVGWSGAFITFFAAMYLLGGWIRPVEAGGRFGRAISWTELPGDPSVLWESLYYSTLTFTALGFGDFRPTGSLGQLLTIVETATGALLLALLVFVLGRRAAR